MPCVTYARRLPPVWSMGTLIWAKPSGIVGTGSTYTVQRPPGVDRRGMTLLTTHRRDVVPGTSQAGDGSRQKGSHTAT